MKDFFLADDLSGALDAAAAFHHAGRRVRVVWTATAWTAGEDEVVGVTTETRNARAAAAAATVEQALAHGLGQGARLVYKKIDSTLRGPVAPELAALARLLPGTRILFTPANPGVGRTVRDGRLLVHGVPVSETEFARDPVWPVTESDLRRLLASVRSPQIVVADAASESDLAAAVARMEAAGQPWVAVGSGALARPVAALTKGPGPARTAGDIAAPSGPLLMLGGSAHPGNRTQAALLAREAGIPLHVFGLADPEVITAAVTASLHAGEGAILLVEEARHDSAAVLRALTAAAVRIIGASGANRIFATGGETAFALCRALGISQLLFEEEIESGLALSRATTASGPLRLAVKPGGFGTPETWLRAWHRLRR